MEIISTPVVVVAIGGGGDGDYLESSPVRRLS